MQDYIVCYKCGNIIKYGDSISIVPWDSRVCCCMECLAKCYGGREMSPEDSECCDDFGECYDDFFNLGKQQ